ncbi:hypothetical protein K435DRAFT_856303 [Dendrothele bispora CBS 962.96]|uniref:Uncharacterized protein n=1 Tax=Dendrothele bispora (strain CBS 962.96) TaxID=1314807 RepID=A0A4S8M8Q8_DENBC|nr:hypothetical protein K435DRAFT_856303 [Dendrothele bispora CBS 962.96]
MEGKLPNSGAMVSYAVKMIDVPLWAALISKGSPTKNNWRHCVLVVQNGLIRNATQSLLWSDGGRKEMIQAQQDIAQEREEFEELVATYPTLPQPLAKEIDSAEIRVVPTIGSTEKLYRTEYCAEKTDEHAWRSWTVNIELYVNPLCFLPIGSADYYVDDVTAVVAESFRAHETHEWHSWAMAQVQNRKNLFSHPLAIAKIDLSSPDTVNGSKNLSEWT